MSGASDTGWRGRTVPWQRWAATVAVLGIGTALGAMLGLAAFGYPPVYLSPPDDDRTVCSVQTERAGAALASELQGDLDEVFPVAWLAFGGAGEPSTPTLTGVRCGNGLRAWATPLRPQQRDLWLDALGSSLVELGFEVPGATPLEAGTGDEVGGPAPAPGMEPHLVNGDATEDPTRALADLRQARSQAAERRDAAEARLREALSPETVSALDEATETEVAAVGRELVDAYRSFQQAQDEVLELDAAIDALDVPSDDGSRQPDDGPDDGPDETPEVTDPTAPSDEAPEGTDPTAPSDETPAEGSGGATSEPDPPVEPEEGVPEAPESEVPTSVERLTISVPTPAVPLALGALLGGLSSSVLVGSWLLWRVPARRSRR